MLAIERRNLILGKLQEEGKVIVTALSQEFGVSEETIRRDLEKLESDGYAVKAYGGAVLNENNNTELPFIVRKNKNVTAKQKIASMAAGLIKDGDCVMLDASSTAVFVAKHLKEKKNMTVITNSIEILLELADVTCWQVLSTGGMVKEGSLALIGRQAEEMLSGFHVDVSVVSCKGMDLEAGFTDSSEMHAEIKKKMLKAARHKVLAVDSSKFGKISFKEIGRFEDLTEVVTDCEPDENWKALFSAAGIECIYSEDDSAV